MSTKKNIKNLVKIMTWAEVQGYCIAHPEWRIPTAKESVDMDKDKVDWDKWWIAEELSGRRLLYSYKPQHYTTTHPYFKHRVVLVRSDNDD